MSPNYNDANRDGNYTWSCNLLGDLDLDPLFPSSVLSAMKLESIFLKVAEFLESFKGSHFQKLVSLIKNV